MVEVGICVQLLTLDLCSFTYSIKYICTLLILEQMELLSDSYMGSPPLTTLCNILFDI